MSHNHYGGYRGHVNLAIIGTIGHRHLDGGTSFNHIAPAGHIAPS